VRASEIVGRAEVIEALLRLDELERQFVITRHIHPHRLPVLVRLRSSYKRPARLPEHSHRSAVLHGVTQCLATRRPADW